jgi:hypothetical protein
VSGAAPQWLDGGGGRARAAGEAGKAGGGAAVGRGEAALEVGGGPDGWAPPVSRRKREKAGALVERAVWAGGELGRGWQKKGGGGEVGRGVGLGRRWNWVR